MKKYMLFIIPYFIVFSIIAINIIRIIEARIAPVQTATKTIISCGSPSTEAIGTKKE